MQPFLKGSSIAHLTACAGVAIARYTHPFFETVQAAETLCRRGKEMLHKRKDNGRAGASFINWEVLQAQVATEQASEERVESGRVREIFHIKPLCVEQEEPVSADGIYGYDTFIELAREIRREEAISNSLLEDWKKNLYSGWEQYKLFFNLRQGTRKLNETVQKFFGDHIRCAAWKIKDGPVTYILNDVLDVLPFMECQEGGGGHVVRAEP